MNVNVVWPAEAVNVCLVLSDGKVAHSTPLPVVFRYWPFVRVPPPAVIVLSNFALLSNSAKALNVAASATFSTSKSVCPSTSKLPFASMLPAKVVTPAMLTLSKFVWPSTSKSERQSKSPFISTWPSEWTVNLSAALVISRILRPPLLFWIQ